jgi:hypothetical protein
MEQVASDGKNRIMNFYNLDMILSVGYRVNSIQATKFRQWATQRLKDYLVQGYAINEKRLAQKEQTYEQMSLFDFAEETEEQKAQKQALQKEKQMQKAMLSIKQRYGKNAILKGTNFKEGATMRQRNGQIGGHRA